jgi:hypothetical protein
MFQNGMSLAKGYEAAPPHARCNYLSYGLENVNGQEMFNSGLKS